MKDITQLTKLFIDDYGRPLELTKGQKGIFNIVLKREPKRNVIICATQYGKSLTVSLGILIRVVVFPEKWAIVSPTERKSKIIMNYIIQHCFDSPLFYSQLEISEPLERLKRERSKERLTFKRGGEVFILSADARNKKRTGEALLGFGAPNLILDESSLIDDDVYATAKRMLGGHKDNFLLEIGNPFRRNHFLRVYQSDLYNKIVINWQQAVEEGRFGPEFIEEMRKEAFFKVLYECEFPGAEEVDEKGWSSLLTDEEIEQAMKEEVGGFGNKRLGADVARGGDNYTVFVLRTDNLAKVVLKKRFDNLMDIVGEIIKLKEEESIEQKDIFVDDIGLGGGVTDRLKEQDIFVSAVKASEKAMEDKKFANLRAEAYWKLREWIKSGGMLKQNEDFYQLAEIKYKVDSASRLKIEGKEEMRARGVESPDVADALMLTFARPNLKGPSRKRPRDDARVNRWYREPEHRRPSY